MSGNGLSLILHEKPRLFICLFRPQENRGPRGAVRYGVLQQVVEHPGQLPGVALHGQILGDIQLYGVAVGLEQGIELVGELHQQIAHIHRLLFQGELLEVIPGDVEKLVDESLQPLGLVQGDVGVLFPLLPGHIRYLVQQAQVADDRGQGRFQVVGQVGNQVVFPGCLLLEGLLPALELAFPLRHLGGDLLLPGREDLAGVPIGFQGLAQPLGDVLGVLPLLLPAGQLAGDEHRPGPQQAVDHQHSQQEGLDPVPVDVLYDAVSPGRGDIFLPGEHEGALHPVHKHPVEHRVQQEVEYQAHHQERQAARGQRPVLTRPFHSRPPTRF